MPTDLGICNGAPIWGAEDNRGTEPIDFTLGAGETTVRRRMRYALQAVGKSTDALPES